jgi:hypothetical protein
MKPTPPDDPTASTSEALTLTLHGTPAPMRDYATAQTRRGRLTMWAILLACALPVVASYLTYFYVRPQGRANYSTLIDPQRPLPDLVALPAQDLDGHSVPLTTLKGQWLLVVVAPASCDPACERRLFMQRQLREMAGAESGRIDKVWLIDGPGPIAPAVAEAIAQAPAVAAYRVDRSALAHWLEPERGHAIEDHLYVVDPLGNWMMRTPANPDPVKVKKDLVRLLQASSWWDRAGRGEPAR